MTTWKDCILPRCCHVECYLREYVPRAELCGLINITVIKQLLKWQTAGCTVIAAYPRISFQWSFTGVRATQKDELACKFTAHQWMIKGYQR